MPNVTCENRTNGQVGFHFVDIHLILVLAEGLLGVLVARFNGFVARWIFTVDDLINNTYRK
jgi:hypothetical protein